MKYKLFFSYIYAIISTLVEIGKKSILTEETPPSMCRASKQFLDFLITLVFR